MGAINDMVNAFGGWLNVAVALAALWILGSVIVGTYEKWFSFSGEARWKVPFLLVFILVLGTPAGVVTGVGKIFSGFRHVGSWLSKPVGGDL